jgi:hypothetical protein
MTGSALYMGDTASDNPDQPGYPLAAVAGYNAGNYVTYPMLVARYGKGRHVLSITPNVDNRADCLDVETGDATAPQAGPWVRQMIDAGIKRPCVYAQESRMSLVRQSLDAAGLARDSYRLWVALWDGGHEVPDGYDAKQFYGTMDPTGWDYSVISPDFFGAPKPKPSYHYDLYRPRFERMAAERYDYWRVRQTAKKKPHRAWMLIRKKQCALCARRIELAIAWDKRFRKSLKDPWSIKDRRFRHPRLVERGEGKRVKPS